MEAGSGEGGWEGRGKMRTADGRLVVQRQQRQQEGNGNYLALRSPSASSLLIINEAAVPKMRHVVNI